VSGSVEIHYTLLEFNIPTLPQTAREGWSPWPFVDALDAILYVATL